MQRHQGQEANCLFRKLMNALAFMEAEVTACKSRTELIGHGRRDRTMGQYMKCK